MHFSAHTFNARLEIIGINPFVSVPEDILDNIFQNAGKTKGHIPICGSVNGQPYQQTLVKYSGQWRLYINTSMLKNSPKRIGEQLEISVAFDPNSREIAPPERFTLALLQNPEAKAVYEALAPYRQLEINRYLSRLKNEATLEKNIQRAINFLLGKERFAGREIQ